MTLSACHNRTVFNQTKDINNDKGWDKDSIVSMTFKPVDTSKVYDLFFLIRNDNNYPYANLFLIAKMTQNHQTVIDTLEYAMADEKGQWLGSGIWDLKESKLIYKKNYRFKDTLPVQMSLQQAVRKSGNILGDQKLPGIKTVGIIIEEANK
jgi:gliding motility-associated lipoprotein GldH